MIRVSSGGCGCRKPAHVDCTSWEGDFAIQTLVIYDISDDKKRTALAKHLMEYGLKRIQYSGFYGQLNPNDRVILAKEVGRYLTEEQDGTETEGRRRDSIYILPLCDHCIKTAKIISEAELSLEEASKVAIVE